MKEEILKEFQRSKKLTTSSLVAKLGISRQAVHRHLQALLREGRIRQFGTSKRTTYYLRNDPQLIREIAAEQTQWHKRYRAGGLQEDRVYRELETQTDLLRELSDNARSLFHYAFTEIVNNAIDHADTDFIDIAVRKLPETIQFNVTDQGSGVFENIRAKKGLANEMEGLQDLLKGKQAAGPARRAGNGIFFTSKVADRLTIESHHKGLIKDNRIGDFFITDIRARQGTRVIFELSTRATLQLTDIFRTYTNEDYQFEKSQVTVKLFQEGEDYVSRAQAKRLLHALDEFKEITLDFQGVTTIGQGFADEIFRVFAALHPDIKIVPINCHENVAFMLKRARSDGS